MTTWVLFFGLEDFRLGLLAMIRFLDFEELWGLGLGLSLDDQEPLRRRGRRIMLHW